MSIEDPGAEREQATPAVPAGWAPPGAVNPVPGRGKGRQVIKAVLVIAALVGVVYGVDRYRQNQAQEKADRAMRALVDALDVDTPSATHTVTYKTSGTALYGSITYETPSGTGQQTDVDIPLTTKSGARGGGISYQMNDGDFVYLSIQNGTDTGSVTCIIEVDGTQILTNTSQGAYAIADCSGSI